MTTDIALTHPQPTLTRSDLAVLLAQAQDYVASGYLPSGVKTAQQALLIMTTGRELGVPATYALRNIHVVNQQPTCSAELLLALVRRTYGPGAIRVGESTATACTVQYREQGWDGVSSYTFTIEDATRAKLTSDTWQKFPAAMLRARAISAVVRFAFPECIAGLYTPEELGAEVTVDAEGQVTILEKDHDEIDRAPVEVPRWVAEYHRRWAQGEAMAREIGAVICVKADPIEGQATCYESLRLLGANIRTRQREQQLETLSDDELLAQVAAGGSEPPAVFR